MTPAAAAAAIHQTQRHHKRPGDVVATPQAMENLPPRLWPKMVALCREKGWHGTYRPGTRISPGLEDTDTLGCRSRAFPKGRGPHMPLPALVVIPMS